MKNIKIIDLTHPIIDNLPVFPGDKPIGLYQNRFLAEDGYNNHRLEIDLHTGTHIDGPMHLTDSNTYRNFRICGRKITNRMILEFVNMKSLIM